MRALVGVVMLVAGCSDESVDTVELGCLDYLPEFPIDIEAPATASVGQPVIVNITTYAQACFRFERTDVEITEDGIDILPLDRHVGGDGACILIVQFLRHQAEVMFDTPGSHTIRVHGRRVDCWRPPCALDERIIVPITVAVE